MDGIFVSLKMLIHTAACFSIQNTGLNIRHLNCFTVSCLLTILAKVYTIVTLDN
jgi:hypothetical protein